MGGFFAPKPDKVLSTAEHIVASADSGIIDQCRRWVNLARAVIENWVPAANVVPLNPDGRSFTS
jgi:hypothetical protein